MRNIIFFCVITSLFSCKAYLGVRCVTGCERMTSFVDSLYFGKNITKWRYVSCKKEVLDSFYIITTVSKKKHSDLTIKFKMDSSCRLREVMTSLPGFD